MPEPYWPKSKSSYRLSDAQRAGHCRHAKVRCTYCKRTVFFQLDELQKVYGDVEVDDVLPLSRWKCSGCGGKGMLDLRLDEPRAGEPTVIRRLVRVDTIYRPRWRDERR